MKKLGLLIVSILALGFINVTLAGGSTVDAKLASSEIMPPVPNTSSYVFDRDAVKSLITQKNSLYQVNCNGLAILKSLGFGDAAQKIFSIGVQEGDFEYTFDLKNCALRGNKMDNTYNYTQSLTEAQALSFAAAFVQNSYLKDKTFYKLGKPFVLYRNSNGPIYPMMKDGMGTTPNYNAVSDIEIDPNDTGGDVVPEYTSFSIMYPYLIDGQEVWEQYGTRAGMTIEVSADGVMSVNARLLPFKVGKRSSEKLSGDDAVRILDNGGNSPFYNMTSSPIKLSAPQKVLVLFNLRRNNKTYLYLSSGIGLKSDVKVDQYAQQPYVMILSDYRIGNTSQ